MNDIDRLDAMAKAYQARHPDTDYIDALLAASLEAEPPEVRHGVDLEALDEPARKLMADDESLTYGSALLAAHKVKAKPPKKQPSKVVNIRPAFRIDRGVMTDLYMMDHQGVSRAQAETTVKEYFG